MGLRGRLRSPDATRAPKPPRIVVERGEGIAPTTPRTLPAAARPVWRATIAALREDGRLDPRVGPVVERYAIAVMRARDLDARLDADGLMLGGDAHPLARLALAHAEAVRRLARELGLSPSARLPALRPAAPARLAPISPIAALMERQGEA